MKHYDLAFLWVRYRSIVMQEPESWHCKVVWAKEKRTPSIRLLADTIMMLDIGIGGYVKCPAGHVTFWSGRELKECPMCYRQIGECSYCGQPIPKISEFVDSPLPQIPQLMLEFKEQC